MTKPPITELDGRPLYTITDYTEEQDAMLALFGGAPAVIGHEMSGIHYCRDKAPDAPPESEAHLHLRRYRCPLVLFNGQVRLIDFNGDVVLLDATD